MISTMNRSINYEFTQTDKVHWLKNFSSFIGSEAFLQEKFEYPKDVADGYAKSGSTEAGLSHLLVNYTTRKDFNYTKKASDEFKLCMYFYQFKPNGSVSIQTKKNEAISYETEFDIILVSGNSVDQKLIIPTGSEVKGVTLVLDENWLKENVNGLICNRIEEIKKGEFFLKLMTHKERVIIEDLMNQDSKDLLLPRVHFNNRILRLIEKTLEDICSRGSAKDSPTNMNRRDFLNLMSIEKKLIHSYTDEFPSITALAKSALMSETKLKKLFKSAYGVGMYEYYQKNRMHVAKSLLREGKFSITEVGMKIGYQNLSNFSTAFRKEFNCLPKDYSLAD